MDGLKPSENLKLRGMLTVIGTLSTSSSNPSVHWTGLKAGTQKGSVTMNNIRGTPWTGTRLWIALRTKKSEKDY